MKMVFGSYEAGMAEHFNPKKRDCMLKVGTSLGQSTAGHGTVLHNPENYFGLKMSMLICLNWIAWIVWKMTC